MTPRHGAFLAGLALVLLAGAAPGAAPADRNAGQSREELQELRGRIEQLRKDVAAAEGTRSEAADALRESEQAISEANRRLHELAAATRTASAGLEALEGQSRDTEARLRRSQAELGRFLHQQYVGGEPEPVRLLLSGEDPNRIARQLVYAGYLSRSRAKTIDALKSDLARLRDLARQQLEKRNELAVIHDESLKARRALEAERKSRSDVLARIARDIDRQRREIGTLQRNENRLARLVESLARMLAARKPPAPRPGEPAAKGPRIDQVPDGSEAGAPFQALRGRLSLPVRGELASRFGSPREDSGLSWKGLYILARAGEAVKAVASGRVVFSEWLRGFGNLLIIDHGGGYMSLYGNNDALLRQVGEQVRAGDAIAAVGNSGGNPDSGLYFELRHQGKPFDPMSWVGAR